MKMCLAHLYSCGSWLVQVPLCWGRKDSGCVYVNGSAAAAATSRLVPDLFVNVFYSLLFVGGDTWREMLVWREDLSCWFLTAVRPHGGPTCHYSLCRLYRHRVVVAS